MPVLSRINGGHRCARREETDSKQQDKTFHTFSVVREHSRRQPSALATQKEIEARATGSLRVF
jgi:hypothetical protein